MSVTVVPEAVVFDIDDTLAQSKQPLTPEMATALSDLTHRTTVAIISGGNYLQFQRQILAMLPPTANLAQLILFPTSGGACYQYDGSSWNATYEERLTDAEAETITQALTHAGTESGYIDFSAPAHGDRIELRGAQVTLSALGQQAPVDEKKAWDPTGVKRDTLRALVAEALPQFDVKRGGTTSIDVTKKGINKAFGIRQLASITGIAIPTILYVGDALFPGGNDEVVTQAGIPTYAVTGPADTLTLIGEMLAI